MSFVSGHQVSISHIFLRNLNSGRSPAAGPSSAESYENKHVTPMSNIQAEQTKAADISEEWGTLMTSVIIILPVKALNYGILSTWREGWGGGGGPACPIMKEMFAEWLVFIFKHKWVTYIKNDSP